VRFPSIFVLRQILPKKLGQHVHARNAEVTKSTKMDFVFEDSVNDVFESDLNGGDVQNNDENEEVEDISDFVGGLMTAAAAAEVC
jgi:hypothetical protein